MNRSQTYRITKHGFTLVETVLALALSSVLILAMFGLIDRTVTYQVNGNDEILASQRLLGLLQDLRSDLGRVAIDPHWQARPASEEAEHVLDLSTDRLQSQLQVDGMDKAAEPVRLAGTSDWMLLTLTYANPRWPADAAHGQQVVWTSGRGGSIKVDTHAANGRLIHAVVTRSPESGVNRTRLLKTSRSTAASPEIVLPNSALSFRYLTGGRWQNHWNSSDEKRLPDAIEVTLQLASESEPRIWIIRTSASPWTRSDK